MDINTSNFKDNETFLFQQADSHWSWGYKFSFFSFSPFSFGKSDITNKKYGLIGFCAAIIAVVALGTLLFLVSLYKS